LFELLTGRKLFCGVTTTEVVAAVIKDDIALDRLPPDLPPAIRRMLARCLERDPRQRLRDTGEARILLADPASIAPSAIARTPKPPERPRASFLAGSAGSRSHSCWPARRAPGCGGSSRRRPAIATHRAGRPLASGDAALSPDGSRIAYIRDAHLYVSALDALAPQDFGLLHVTSHRPFWSPDGRTIGFSMAGAMNTIPAAGGPIRQVCKVPAIGRALDVAWRLDGTIVFAVARDIVYTVPAEGGTPKVYLAVDPKTEIEFTSVSPLPDNRVIVTTRLRDPPSYRTELVGSGTDSSTDDDHRRPRRDVRQVRSARRPDVQTAGANAGIWAAPFDDSRVNLAGAVQIAPRGTSFQTDATGTALIRLPPRSRSSSG
jgi:eukaryotic-like serine/threonine-protein kinase